MPILEVDHIDRELLEALQRDARTTVMRLATDLGIARSTVHARLAALKSRDAFKVTGLVDPAYLGRPVVVVFIVQTHLPPAQVLDYVWQLPNVAWAASMTDGVTVVLQASFTSLAEVSTFLDTSLRSHAGIRSVDPHIITSVVNPATTPGTEPPTAWLTAHNHRVLSDIDLAIAKALQTDGRASYGRIAEATGLSVAATRQRTLKLISSGVVQIRTMVDPSVLGQFGLGILCIEVRDDAATVAMQVVRLDDVHYVDQTLGRYPVLAEFHCANVDALLKRRRQVEELAGVSSARLLQIQSSPSYGGAWS